MVRAPPVRFVGLFVSHSGSHFAGFPRMPGRGTVGRAAACKRMRDFNALTICAIIAVISGLSSCTAVMAWSVTGHHPASVGHHTAGVGHHHHHYYTTSPHNQAFSQASSQYSHIQYNPDVGYSHGEQDMLRRVESVRQQQQERDSHPPPLFTAVAAAAASGEPFLLDFPLKRASFAAASASAAATPAATTAATATAATAGATGRQTRRRQTVIIGPVSLQRAATAAGYQPSKSRPQGACSSLKKVYIINVTSAADFAARASLPPTSTVILYLRNDLTLPKGLFFRRQQSCTILMSSKWPGYTLTGGDPTYPVLRVWNTNNFLSMNVNYYLPVTESSPECTTVPELGKGVTCPTISIHRSYGVQIGKGNIFGRVDVFRSMGVRLDSLTVTGVASFDKSPGVIRVAMCGYGPALLQANIIISNNEVYGVNTPIVLHRGAVGVTVTNNYIHNYIFAGIRCGADVHYSGDCMLTRINSNLVISSGRNLNGDHDSAGIYYCTHWFNPGNSALCNYIFNGDHCYYLDYCTSGVLVRGGACINTYDGMKVNNGKRNIIRHVAMKGTQGSLGWTSCLTVTINNCLKDPGSYWEAMRVKYYNSDRINRLWPWMQDVCKETSANGGVPCNPPGQPGADVTGACSGLGTDNLIDVVAVNTTDYGLDWKFCDNYTITEQLNTQINITLDHPYAAGFRNYRRNDLGLKKSSVILKYRPNYLSCQLGLTGPRKFSEKSFYRGFNIPMPWGFRKVVRMDTKHIIDQDLITSAVRAQMKAAGDDGEYSWLGKPFLVGS